MTTPRKIHYVGTLQKPNERPENVELFLDKRPDITSLEASNGIIWVNPHYPPGHLYRYSGPVVFSTTGVAGTDISAAWQLASNSGHPIYIPEGWFSSETLVTIISGGAEAGGKSFRMESGTRIERFTNVSDPIVHIAGTQNHIDFGGGILAARSFGGFSRGLLLYGQNPAATDNTGATEIETFLGIMDSVKVIGANANTGADGSVGIYFESSFRRRGQFLTPTQISTYNNRFTNLYATQWDYPFFLSTDFNGNLFTKCVAKSFGAGAFWVNGYANSFPGCWGESPLAQGTTERGGFVWGNKDSGPEAANQLCEEDATELTIIAITNGSPTIIQTSASHGESTENLIKLDNIVDSGANDLEAALNTNHYRLTSTGADTFTIPVDTTGLATWSSGGTVNTDPYPILGSRANHTVGTSELLFDIDTKRVRQFIQERPGGNFDTEKAFFGTFGKNVTDVMGAMVGGITKTGSTLFDSMLNNVVKSTAIVVDFFTTINFHGWQWRRLDDNSGSSFGTDEHKSFSGRVADMAESFTYDLLSWDNIGATSASGLIELVIQVKDAAGQDHMGGPITFMCPVTASTARPALEVVRHFAHFGNANEEPILVPIVVEEAGTNTNTGKFTLKLATQVLTGLTGDSFCDWHARLTTSQLEGNNVDWDRDIELLTSSTSGLVLDTKWSRKTKFKLINTVKNSDDTLADDPHLNTWPLDDDTEYVIDGMIQMSTNATPDFSCKFDFSNATQDVRIGIMEGGTLVLQTADAGTMDFGFTDINLKIHGKFKTNATTGGDVSFQWAQLTSDAAATTLYAGGWIKIVRADAMRNEIL